MKALLARENSWYKHHAVAVTVYNFFVPEEPKMLRRSLPVTDMHHAYPRQMFGPEMPRATVAMLFSFRGQVLLVRPKNAPEGWYILPQEGIKERDRNLHGSLVRGGGEELGFAEGSYLRPAIIGGFRNPLPAERGGGEKLIMCVASRLRSSQVTLNAENSDYLWVSSMDELEAAMARVAEERVLKSIATRIAVRRACKTGLLPWRKSGQEELAAA